MAKALRWFPLFLALSLKADPEVHLSTFSRAEDPWQAAITTNYLRAKMGLHYDSHPLARIDQEIFPLSATFPRPFLLNLEGGFTRVEFAGHLFRDLAEPQGLGLRSRFWFLSDFYFNTDRFTRRLEDDSIRQKVDIGKSFDRYSWLLDLGPTLREGRLHLDLLFKAGQHFVGREGFFGDSPYYSTFAGIQPTLTLKLSPDFELFGGLRYQHEWIREVGPENDAEHAIGFLGGRYLVGEQLFLLTAAGGYHHFRPDFGYWEGGARLDWFTKLPLALEGRIGLAYKFRAFPAFLESFKRWESHRFDSNLALVKRFGQFFAETWWDFGLNRGNDVVSYDRHAVGVNVGFEL